MAKVFYKQKANGKREYSNLTQKDRIALRNAKNRGKALSLEERNNIFGVNPKFIKTN